MTPEDRRAEIKLGELEPAGFVLDLGCGGEGIIARAYPGRVIGVDQQLSEINQCRPKCPAETVFLVADATRLQFVDNTFGFVTAFFALMYVRGTAAKRALFAEAARILRPGGTFHVWDAVVPAGEDVFGLEVTVTLPSGEVVKTGYGVRGPGKEQNLEKIITLATGAGLAVLQKEDHGIWFHGIFVKPKNA